MKVTTRQINMVLQFLKQNGSEEAQEGVKFYTEVLQDMLKRKQSEKEVDLIGLGEAGTNFIKVLNQLENKQNLINETIRSSRSK